jgi:NtrC-family two-component system response regulator AlgB
MSVIMSSTMRSVHDLVAQAAEADVPVLFRGESGTGKGVLARLLHAQSHRSRGPFVVTSGAILTGGQIASELFGHARGAFPGALRATPGRVEAAVGGTLFLDEVGEVPFPAQAQLLRFLQGGVYERLGETRTRRVDVRVIAATSRDLEADIRGGRFREDLFYCLNLIEIEVPALRERREDILPLVHELLETLTDRAHREVPTLTESVERALTNYGWPGNVRELRNVIERALILCPEPTLDLSAFPGHIAVAPSR